MARKNATRPSGSTTIASWAQIQKDLRNGHFFQALSAARQFHAQKPSEASAGAIRDALVGLVDAELRQDRIVDARRHLDEAAKLDGPLPTWPEQLALLCARSGDWQSTRRMLDRVPGTSVSTKALGHLVDRALREPKNGKAALPGDLHEGFDAIVTAFAQYERGDDEAVRQSLQAFGMQSPFLEWKLLLRGLIAYSANDDPRALENWQRLDAARLPASIAAPLRFQIDANYRTTLPSDQAQRIAERSDKLALPMLASLRKVQRSLSSAEKLPDALRQVRPLMGMLKMNAPQLLPKLANCFYWLIIVGGHPDDMEEFDKVFGKPVDDPQFCRLIAMATEAQGQLGEAHKEWEEYADWIAEQTQRFPGEFGKRARATIFLRMGDNALEHDRVRDASSPENFLDFLRNELHHGQKRKPLKPSAEACYRNAMNLAPDWKEPLARLLDLYAEQRLWENAEVIGKKLIRRFPDDSEALVALSEVLHHQAKDAEALEVLRTALTHNPLDGVLRGVVAQLTMRMGREQTLAGNFDSARASFQESLKLDPEIIARMTKACWAACEFKAGCPEAARHRASDLQATQHWRVAAALMLTAETTRVKAGKAVQAEYKSQFEDLLKGEVSLKELVQLLVAWNMYQDEADRYHGLGTHEKKIVAKVLHLVENRLPEAELAAFGMLLADLRLTKPLKLLADQGRSHFPKNPTFMLLQAVQTIFQRPRSFDLFRASYALANVFKLIEGKDDPMSIAMRKMVDDVCDEHPRLREIVERQRDLFGPSPDEDFL